MLATGRTPVLTTSIPYAKMHAYIAQLSSIHASPIHSSVHCNVSVWSGQNSTDPRGVTGLHDVRKGANTSAMTPGRVPGNDAEFIVDRFLTFMRSTLSENLKFYAHLTFHAIHEPHPAMPEFYRYYKNDPDYLGALTMFDGQLGRLIEELKTANVYNNTVIFYTADSETSR